MTPPAAPAGQPRSSDTTLAQEDRPSSSEQPASTLQPPNPSSKYDAYLSGASTRAGSPARGDQEKKEQQVEGSVKEEQPEAMDEGEYPTGWAFTFIVVALVLSVFLVSLDMVRVLLFPLPLPITYPWTDKYVPRPSSPPPSPRLQTSSKALATSPGTGRPSS